MLRGYWPVIIGLISFLAPFAIVGIELWRKKDKPFITKIGYTIVALLVGFVFSGIVMLGVIYDIKH